MKTRLKIEKRPSANSLWHVKFPDGLMLFFESFDRAVYFADRISILIVPDSQGPPDDFWSELFLDSLRDYSDEVKKEVGNARD